MWAWLGGGLVEIAHHLGRVENGTVQRSIFDVVGEDGIDQLSKAFYSQVPGDEILGPMYPEGQIEAARLRLRDFLVGRFGGPQRYIEQRGHPRLRMRHMPFPIDRRARDRWVELMSNALEEVDFPPEVDGALSRFFADTATFMINRTG